MFRTRIPATIAALAVAVTAIGLSASPAGAAVKPPLTSQMVFAKPAAPETPGPMTASLTVARNQALYTVQVKGVVSMSQAGAADLISRGYRVTWELWGSDPVSDDFQFGPDPASIIATSRGLEFTGVRVASGSLLDEDDSFFDDHDELYASVRLLNASGGTVKSAQSNEVGGYF